MELIRGRMSTSTTLLLDNKIDNLFVLFLENYWQVFVRRLSIFTLLRLLRIFESLWRYLIFVKLFDILLQHTALLANISTFTCYKNLARNSSTLFITIIYLGHFDDLICDNLLIKVCFMDSKNLRFFQFLRRMSLSFRILLGIDSR